MACIILNDPPCSRPLVAKVCLNAWKVNSGMLIWSACSLCNIIFSSDVTFSRLTGFLSAEVNTRSYTVSSYWNSMMQKGSPDRCAPGECFFYLINRIVYFTHAPLSSTLYPSGIVVFAERLCPLQPSIKFVFSLWMPHPHVSIRLDDFITIRFTQQSKPYHLCAFNLIQIV